MDLIRAVAKALFFDFPEPDARKIALYDYSTRDFNSSLKEVLCHSTLEFSRNEVSAIIELANDRWIRPWAGHPGDQSFSPVSLFNVLAAIGKECLDLSKSIPAVKFDNLLRWRDVTYAITEDLVISATLTDHDLHTGLTSSRDVFAWPDILDHDNVVINRVLDRGLSDTHAHLNATSDIFMLNWLSMMNSQKSMESMVAMLDRDSYLKDTRFPMQREMMTPVHGRVRSFYSMGVTAALCRAWLFAMVNAMPVAGHLMDLLTGFLEDERSFSGQDFYRYVNLLRLDAMKSVYGHAVDYAVTGVGKDDINSPYLLLRGERQLMYMVLQRIFRGNPDTDQLSRIFYLYVILKNRIRREFIQTNPLVGFENFQMYQSRKNLFFNDIFWDRINLSYAVASSLGEQGQNSLEGRVTPEALKNLGTARILNPYARDSRGRPKLYPYNEGGMSGNFSIVVHFIKKQVLKGSGSRYRQLLHFRTELWRDMNVILGYMASSGTANRVRGIDVAGSELNCRPEIFAPMFRWAKSQGIGNNMTYHAGEDFYDLVDGLRTIHEAVVFMNFDSGCRIGHALALGTEAGRFYKEKHCMTVAPSQIVLDNLIWMKYFAAENNIPLSQQTLDFIESVTYDLLDRIGYKERRSRTSGSKVCDRLRVDSRLDYWHSMLMRGNDAEIELDQSGSGAFTTRSLTSVPDILLKDGIRLTELAKSLYEQYEMDSDIFVKGRVPYQTKIPHSFISDVAALQKGLTRLLWKTGITVEANPSSNLKIGRVGRYDELPLFQLFPIDGDADKRMSVSVNTDDRGVFGTSLRNEYSLVAAALMKMRDPITGKHLYSVSQVAEYIEALARNGRESLFKPIKITKSGKRI